MYKIRYKLINRLINQLSNNSEKPVVKCMKKLKQPKTLKIVFQYCETSLTPSPPKCHKLFE